MPLFNWSINYLNFSLEKERFFRDICVYLNWGEWIAIASPNILLSEKNYVYCKSLSFFSDNIDLTIFVVY